MKKYHLIPAAALLLLSGAVTVTASADGGNENKVTVIHNGKEIKVAPAAVAAHLAHGDVLPPPPDACPTYPNCDNDDNNYDEEEEAQ